MLVSVNPVDKGNVQNLNLDIPHQCPLCHREIDAESGVFKSTLNRDTIEVLIRCPSRSCRRAFIAYYKRSAANTNAFEFDKVAPAEPKQTDFDPVITNLSPDFVRIHAQATCAEAAGLDDVAGPRFRKALEFLLKDYAISLSPPKDHDNIKAIPLASVINNYFSKENMKVVGSQAAWLGNDETHYERRWVGKDLQDLKNLIMASVHFIAMERLVANLPSDMPSDKKK